MAGQRGCVNRGGVLHRHPMGKFLGEMISFPHSSRVDELFHMGRRQAVRHRSLEPAFGGSNPPAPVSSFPLLSTCARLALSGHGKG